MQTIKTLYRHWPLVSSVLQFSFDRWVDPAGVYFYAAEVVELVGNASKAYIQKQVIQLFEFPVSYKHFFQINAKCAAKNRTTCQFLFVIAYELNQLASLTQFLITVLKFYVKFITLFSIVLLSTGSVSDLDPFVRIRIGIFFLSPDPDWDEIRIRI